MGTPKDKAKSKQKNERKRKPPKIDGDFPSGFQRIGFMVYFFAAAVTIGIGLCQKDIAQAYAYYGLSALAASTTALFANLNRKGDLLIGLVALPVGFALFSGSTSKNFFLFMIANDPFVCVFGIIAMLTLASIGPRGRRINPAETASDPAASGAPLVDG